MKKGSSDKNHKTREERITDAVLVLSKLKSVGADKDIGYTQTKDALDKWINEGGSWQGKIDFPRYDRYVELFLPWRTGVQPTCVLRSRPRET